MSDPNILQQFLQRHLDLMTSTILYGDQSTVGFGILGNSREQTTGQRFVFSSYRPCELSGSRHGLSSSRHGLSSSRDGLSSSRHGLSSSRHGLSGSINGVLGDTTMSADAREGDGRHGDTKHNDTDGNDNNKTTNSNSFNYSSTNNNGNNSNSNESFQSHVELRLLAFTIGSEIVKQSRRCFAAFPLDLVGPAQMVHLEAAFRAYTSIFLASLALEESDLLMKFGYTLEKLLVATNDILTTISDRMSRQNCALMSTHTIISLHGMAEACIFNMKK